MRVFVLLETDFRFWSSSGEDLSHSSFAVNRESSSISEAKFTLLNRTKATFRQVEMFTPVIPRDSRTDIRKRSPNPTVQELSSQLEASEGSGEIC